MSGLRAVCERPSRPSREWRVIFDYELVSELASSSKIGLLKKESCGLRGVRCESQCIGANRTGRCLQ